MPWRGHDDCHNFAHARRKFRSSLLQGILYQRAANASTRLVPSKSLSLAKSVVVPPHKVTM